MYSDGVALCLAEQTFIVLDKELVVGDFIHGEPHIEGQFTCCVISHFSETTILSCDCHASCLGTSSSCFFHFLVRT